MPEVTCQITKPFDVYPDNGKSTLDHPCKKSDGLPDPSTKSVVQRWQEARNQEIFEEAKAVADHATCRQVAIDKAITDGSSLRGGDRICDWGKVTQDEFAKTTKRAKQAQRKKEQIRTKEFLQGATFEQQHNQINISLVNEFWEAVESGDWSKICEAFEPIKRAKIYGEVSYELDGKKFHGFLKEKKEEEYNDYVQRNIRYLKKKKKKIAHLSSARKIHRTFELQTAAKTYIESGEEYCGYASFEERSLSMGSEPPPPLMRTTKEIPTPLLLEAEEDLCGQAQQEPFPLPLQKGITSVPQEKSDTGEFF